MRSDIGPVGKCRRFARWAQAGCLVLGAALLVWGLAPAIIARLVTGRPPAASTLAISGLVMLLGVGFIVLSVFVARGLTWALWTVLCLSSFLLMGNLTLTLLLKGHGTSAFPLLLATGTAAACVLALDARRRDEKRSCRPGTG